MATLADDLAKARAKAAEVVKRIAAAAAAAEELHDLVLDLPYDHPRFEHYSRGTYAIADQVRDLQDALEGIWTRLPAERIKGHFG